MSQVPEEEDAETRCMEGEQDYLVTIRLVGFGRPEQVKKEYKLALRRMLELEFGDQIKSCKIVPISSIRLD